MDYPIWKKVVESSGTRFEGKLEEKLPYAVVTSNSTLQILFHRPAILLRKSIMIDQCRLIGSHECFLEGGILHDLMEFLGEDPLIYFFLEVNGERWTLSLDSIYDGDTIDEIERICRAFYSSFKALPGSSRGAEQAEAGRPHTAR